jgi:cytochrome b561
MNHSTTSYTKTAKALHWLIAIGIFGMFALGWFMSDLPKEAPKQKMGIQKLQQAWQSRRLKKFCR